MAEITRTVKYAIQLTLIMTVSFGCASRKKITDQFLYDKYANDQSKFLSLGNLKIHYRDEGEGMPLVLLHGMSSSLHTWDNWSKELSESYRIIRLDLPGFGLTGPDPQHEYSMKRATMVLHSFLQALDIERCYMAGNSLGGWIAWEYTLDHPQMVSKLILIDAAGFITPDNPPTPIRMAQKPIFKRLVMKGAPRFVVRKFLKQAYGDRSKVHKELINRYFELNNRSGNPQAFYIMANSEYQARTDRLVEIKVPTLIMWGEEDKKWIDVSHAYLFQELLPNDQLIIYQGVGHVPMEEIPKRSAADARKFLLE